MRRNNRTKLPETPKETRLLEKGAEAEVVPKGGCTDIYCAVIFILYLLAMIAVMGLSIYSGHYATIGTVVDSKGNECGGTLNQGFPYLLYAQPCTDQLGTKVCVDSCYIDATTPPNISPNASSACSALITVGTDTCPLPDCKFYQSSAYLQKICLPTSYSTFPAVEDNLVNNEGINISISNIAATYKPLLMIGGCIVILAILAFLLFLCCPKIMYFYVAITFLGLLFLAFYSMKMSKVRETAYSTSGFSSIALADQRRIQYVSYVIFGFFLLTSPLVLFGYRRLNFAIRLCHALKGFYRRMVTMYFFELFMQILIVAAIGFQVFIGCNLLTYGNAVTPTNSPYAAFSASYVGLPIYIFELVGSYWLLSVMACFCQFLVACNMWIWYSEETSELPAFSPLKRSLGRSIYHFGSIALDAFLVPFTWLLLVLFELLRQEEEDDDDDKVGLNKCSLCLRVVWRKIFSAFEISQSYLNRGGYCVMVQKNTNFFQSNKLYYTAIRARTRNIHHLGTLMYMFATLVVVAISLIGTYFYLQTTFISPYLTSLPAVSSLAVPLALILICSLLVGGVFGSILNYSIDTLIYHHITISLTAKLDQDRKAFEVDEYLSSI